MSAADDTEARAPLTATRLLFIVLPLALLALAAWWLVAADPLRNLGSGAPPVETVTFERTILDSNGIHLQIRAGGSEPLTIAQVTVDEAFWIFTLEPAGEIARGATAWLHIPYPYVVGEPVGVMVITKAGTTFEHEIAVALPTPQATRGELIPQALVGAFVGVLPVALGLLFYPALGAFGRKGLDFILALTIGLLVFLLVDTLDEALEISGEAAALFQGHAMVLLAALASFLILMAIGRRHGVPTGVALAFYIALGIGLHNLGEGLAIGAAFATGAASLGTFLILGFTLHNITEGIGIAAPLVRARPPFLTFVALALIAGAPAILGMWLGSLAYSAQWASFALAIGAGAILQVVVEVGAYLGRRSGRGAVALLDAHNVAGLLVGFLVMYLTAMLVSA